MVSRGKEQPTQQRLGSRAALSRYCGGKGQAAHAPAGTAEASSQPAATQTLTATVNLAGPTVLTDADRAAIIKTAAAEAGVDPASVSIGHVTVRALLPPASVSRSLPSSSYLYHCVCVWIPSVRVSGCGGVCVRTQGFIHRLLSPD